MSQIRTIVDGDTRDYEVGYRKPPISAMFPKGVSGNPSGRPKKAPDFESQLLREFDSKLKINENGKRISVTKFELLAKQLVNKAVTTGNVSTIRLLLPYYQQALDKAAEQWQKSTSNPNLDVRDLTTDELLEIIKAGAEESAKAKLEKSIEADFENLSRRSLRYP